MTAHANTLNDENLGVHGRFYLLYETSLYQPGFPNAPHRRRPPVEESATQIGVGLIW